MIKSIVVPSDFSANARTAVVYAAALGDIFNCKTFVLHAYSAFHSGFQSAEANEKERLKAEDQARRQMAEFLSLLPADVLNKLEPVLVQGHLPDALLEWERTQPVDLVIIGTKGASNFGQKLIGSNAFELAQKSPAPVIVVPKGTENFNLEQIAFFTDYASEDARALKEISRLFNEKAITYKIIHIHAEETHEDESKQDFGKFKDWVNQLQREAAVQEVSSEMVYGKEHVDLVNQISERGNIDLLALSLNEKSFFERFFQDSFAKAIIHQSKTPVLLIRTYNS